MQEPTPRPGDWLADPDTDTERLRVLAAVYAADLDARIAAVRAGLAADGLQLRPDRLRRRRAKAGTPPAS